MAKDQKLNAANEIHRALAALSPEDQLTTIKAVLTLLGIDERTVGAGSIGSNRSGSSAPPMNRGAAQNSGGQAGEMGTAREFFATKNPQGKIEDISVAARYRELTAQAEEHTVDELKATFRDARRNFSANFPRDLRNAKQQGYFNKGKQIVLSHFGQEYVDALPNREAARSISRPTRGAGKRAKRGKGKSVK